MISGISRSIDPDSHLEIRKKRLKETCQDFEAVMTNYMMKTMRQSIMKAEEPDQARELYESMMDESIAKEMSRNQSCGLADILYERLVPLVEAEKKSGKGS